MRKQPLPVNEPHAPVSGAQWRPRRREGEREISLSASPHCHVPPSSFSRSRLLSASSSRLPPHLPPWRAGRVKGGREGGRKGPLVRTPHSSDKRKTMYSMSKDRRERQVVIITIGRDKTGVCVCVCTVTWQEEDFAEWGEMEHWGCECGGWVRLYRVRQHLRRCIRYINSWFSPGILPPHISKHPSPHRQSNTPGSETVIDILPAMREHALDHLALNWAPLHNGPAIMRYQLSTGNITTQWTPFPLRRHAAALKPTLPSNDSECSTASGQCQRAPMQKTQ